jgi:hypothetical protein
MKYIMGFHKHYQFLKMNIQVAKRYGDGTIIRILRTEVQRELVPITKLHEYEAVFQNPFPGILGLLLLICSIEAECGIHPQAPSGVGDRL